MDQPQHQVFGTGKQSYRFMSFPPPKQPLQLLYPGRFMLNSYHYDGSNIPNENPIGLQESREEMAAFAHASKMEQEALSRHLGGKDKVVNHPAVEPEAVIEDPSLKLLTVKDTMGLNPNLENVKSKYDDLRKIDSMDNEIVTKYREDDFLRGESPMTQHNIDNVLLRYDWDKRREYYTSDNISTYKDCSGNNCTIYTCNNTENTCSQQMCDKNGNNCQNPSSCDYAVDCGSKHKTSNTKDSNKIYLWISVIVLTIVAVIAIIIFIYGMHKNKTNSDSLKPNNYAYLNPQFLPPDMNIGGLM